MSIAQTTQATIELLEHSDFCTETTDEMRSVIKGFCKPGMFVKLSFKVEDDTKPNMDRYIPEQHGELPAVTPLSEMMWVELLTVDTSNPEHPQYTGRLDNVSLYTEHAIGSVVPFKVENVISGRALQLEPEGEETGAQEQPKEEEAAA